MSIRILYSCRSFLWKLATKDRQPLPSARRFINSTITQVSKANVLAAPQVSTKSPLRVWKYARRTGYVLGALGTTYAIDKTYNASAIFRNMKTVWTCAAITYDYKMNFTAEKSAKIPEVHERVGQRVYDLLSSNGGLYIKIGQAIGANAAALPPAIQSKFTSLFDDAPQIPYSDVHTVFVKELGRPPSGPDGVFEIFEEQAVASASIAQVHKAKLWPRVRADGKPETEERWVAVKVQKPDVGKQMEWDLGAFRAMMWMFEHWAFDLPVYFVVDFISDHLRQELDFVQEAENSRKTAEFVANEPRLRDKVYIPYVYPEYSTKKVMVAEWIDGVRLSDKAGIFDLMGERIPEDLPSSSNTDVTSQQDTSSIAAAVDVPHPAIPSTFKAPSQPLKGGVKSVMQTMIELFSSQMFEWGQVHCDPHPGNVLVRPSPLNPREPQIVLLDHGLYVHLHDGFRREWASLWRAMLVGDYKGVNDVAKEWGFAFPDLVATFTLMKPTILKRGREKREVKQETEDEKGNEKPPPTEYEVSIQMKAKLQEFLADTDRMPKALIFLNRNMRMMQANNQSFGAPVNRTKIMGFLASKSQTRNTTLTFSERQKEWWHHIMFQNQMLRLEFSFWKTFVFMWLGDVRARLHLGGKRTGASSTDGMTDEEQLRAARDFLQESMGIEIPDSVLEKAKMP
ncbi:hypothetical protein GALMADRAFT_245116 [Galerina marginata CBS 339.88]|uniref:ABC1 atypical kinase-like domain-containing protein n=1 Tax=Galerina marginata (strain CBS 339.88) TaxID=685588 RepID=A0A067TDY1_GALM3|nr:hypothetical protein GALMADRAFT_245116 [Galerina marginata CBS 339.88]